MALRCAIGLNSSTAIVFIALFLFSGASAHAQEEPLIFQEEKEWEKLGLSQTEWMMIQKEKMPREKVELLLKAGIGIAEYFTKPWVELGLSEEEWILKRQKGMEDEDMAPRSRGTRDDWAPIHNFFLPGFHHFGRKQYGKAYTMSGIAVAAVGLTVVSVVATQKKADHGFSPMYPLLILGADMVWSSVDILMQINKEKNPDANRFSLHESCRIKVSVNWNVKSRN
jgi:hypothetical protein